METTASTAVPTESEENARVLEEIDREHERQRERAEQYLAHWKPVRAACEPFIGQLVRCSYKSPVAVSVAPQQLKGILIKCYGVRTFRDVTPLLRAIRRAGYEMQEPEDYPEIGRRMWSFRPTGMPDVVAHVLAFVRKDGEGAGCRVVTRTKEVEVREIVCPEDEQG